MATERQQHLMTSIINRIVEQGPGWTLPPQDKLCIEYRVSRTLLREVLSILEFLNVINVKPKTGTTVNKSGEWRCFATEVNSARVRMTEKDFGEHDVEAIIERSEQE